MHPAALRGNTHSRSPSRGHFGIHEHDWWHRGWRQRLRNPLSHEEKWLLSRTHSHYIGDLNIGAQTHTSPIICNFNHLYLDDCIDWGKCKNVSTPQTHWKLWTPHTQDITPGSITTRVSDREVTIISQYITATAKCAVGANKVTWPVSLQALPFSPF